MRCGSGCWGRSKFAAATPSPSPVLACATLLITLALSPGELVPTGQLIGLVVMVSSFRDVSAWPAASAVPADETTVAESAVTAVTGR